MQARKLNDPLARFLRSLEGKGADALFDAFQNEALETGGTMIGPRQGDNWGPVMVEVQMHGIFATGAHLDEAFANWRKIALAEAARRDQIAGATDLIYRAADASPDELRRACTAVLELSSDHINCTRARNLLAALNRAA